MKKIWKDNARLILAIFATIILASGATYAATIMYDSNTVGYDNMTSGLRSTNVQSALDELYGNVAEVILNIKAIIGNSTLTTTDQTLTGAANELDDKISNIGDSALLWANLSGTTSGEITMKESIYNFQYILIQYRTNAEQVSQLVNTHSIDLIIFQNVSLFPGTGLQSDYAYKAQASIRFTSGTKATVTTAYNNGNLVLKPTHIYGINRMLTSY